MDFLKVINKKFEEKKHSFHHKHIYIYTGHKILKFYEVIF